MTFPFPLAPTSATTSLSFNGSGRAITAVTLPRSETGLVFVRLDIPLGQTVQIRILSDLIILGSPSQGLGTLANETAFEVGLFRQGVGADTALREIPSGLDYVDDPYRPEATIPGVLFGESITEFNFQTTASTRGLNTGLIAATGSYYVVIQGKGAEYLPGEFLSGRLAIEVSGDTSAPLGEDPRALLFGPDWLQMYQPGAVTPPGQGQVQTGGAGADTLIGGVGNDTIGGAGGLDYLRGGEGSDSISGGTAFDDVHGNQGDDTVAGGPDDDWVVGGKGEDLLYGDDGNDLVLGNIGNDTCEGGAGADTVRGGQGNDILRGGAGDDYLSGDRGSDTVTGGAGADVFHSFGEAGLDRVTDFNRAEGDSVRLDPGTQYTAVQSGADVVINMVGGGQLVLAGVSLGSLTNGWILVG